MTVDNLEDCNPSASEAKDNSSLLNNGLSMRHSKYRPFRSLGAAGQYGAASQASHDQYQHNILFKILSEKSDQKDSGASLLGGEVSRLKAERNALPTGGDYLVDLSGRIGGPGEFLTPGDYRQRSQSMGSTGGWAGGFQMCGGGRLDLSRTSSHDSLASFDSQSDSSQSNNLVQSQSESQLLEVTRSRLMQLLMAPRGGDDSDNSTTTIQGVADEKGDDASIRSHPGTPPSSTMNPSVAWRKYSEGSQRGVYLKAKLMSVRGGSYLSDRNGAGPSKQTVMGRKKPYSRPDIIQTGHRGLLEEDTGSDEGFDPGQSEQSSLLQLMLTRGRSNSLSVVESYRLQGLAYGRPLGAGLNKRQPVTLAKKNRLPIVARVTDRLNKVLEFATSLPEFTRLPVSDRATLLVSACPRLLLLYMAEMNLQFAVTQVHDGELPLDTSVAEETVVQGVGMKGTVAVPTEQFVDSVQAFIRKCQGIGVTANEYFYMRMIALFYTGTSSSHSLVTSSITARMYSEARQDLQELVQHHHPHQTQRYVTLLLTLHTLFGVNCAMLEALFCDPLVVGEEGLEGFIRGRLRQYNPPECETQLAPPPASESSSSSLSSFSS